MIISAIGRTLLPRFPRATTIRALSKKLFTPFIFPSHRKPSSRRIVVVYHTRESWQKETIENTTNAFKEALKASS